MPRRVFSREFKLEAVKLVRDRGVAAVQACRDLDIAESVLRRWIGRLQPIHSRPFPATARSSPSSWRLTGCGVLRDGVRALRHWFERSPSA